MKEIRADSEISNNSTVLPIMESWTWIKNLYSMIWKDQWKHSIEIQFEIFDHSNPKPFGICSTTLSNKNGTIKYGGIDLPIYKIPTRIPEGKSHILGSNLIIIIDNPKEVAEPKFSEPMKVKPDLKIDIPESTSNKTSK